MNGTGIVTAWDIRRFGTVTSTMDVAAGLIAAGDLAGPVVVVADHQTAGRGRAGRRWRSVPGTALQMTAILSLPVPAVALGPVPLIVGGMVAEALEVLDPGLDLALKWPNDVLVDGRKVAGILIVSRSSGGTSLVQIGIGVNIADPLEPVTGAAGLPGLVETGSGQRSIDPIRDQLLGEMLSRLARLPEELARDGGAAGLGGWTRRAAMLGQPVIVRDGERTVEGTLLGVDRNGALRLRTSTGAITRVVAGDLTRGPRPWMDQDGDNER